jgi:hypothetical protein
MAFARDVLSAQNWALSGKYGGLAFGFEPSKVWGLTVLIKPKPWPSQARFHSGTSAKNRLESLAGILLV